MIQLVMVLVALSPVVFLIGLIRPKWILFWVKEPDRLIASSVGILMFMATFTAYSEMRVKHRQMVDGAPARQQSHDQQNELQLDRLR